MSREEIRNLRLGGRLRETDLISTRADGGWRPAVRQGSSTSKSAAVETSGLPSRRGKKKAPSKPIPRHKSFLVAGICTAIGLVLATLTWLFWPHEPEAQALVQEAPASAPSQATTVAFSEPAQPPVEITKFSVADSASKLLETELVVFDSLKSALTSKMSPPAMENLNWALQTAETACSKLTANDALQLEKLISWSRVWTTKAETAEKQIPTHSPLMVSASQLSKIDYPSEVSSEIISTRDKLIKEINMFETKIPGNAGNYAVIIGQIQLQGMSRDDWKETQRRVNMQCEVLPYGYFVAAIGDIRNPLAIRASGYHSVDLQLSHLADRRTKVFNIAPVTLQPVLDDSRIVFRGKLHTDGGSSEAAGTRTIKLELAAGKSNTPEGNLGTIFERGIRYENPHFISPSAVNCDDHGYFEFADLQPDRYVATFSAPNHIPVSRTIPVAQGDCLPFLVRLLPNFTYNVRFTASWLNGKIETQNLKSNEWWRFSEQGVPRKQWALTFFQEADEKHFLRSSYAPWYFMNAGPSSLENVVADLASLTIRRSPPKTPIDLGNSFVIKNSRQTEWVAFELREGAIESPTITVPSSTQGKTSQVANSQANQSVNASTSPARPKRVFPAAADPERLFAAQRRRLAKSISGDWNQSSIPLREAVSFIAEREKIPIWLDERSLTGITKPDTRINLDLGPGSLGAELQSRLRTYGLTLVPPPSDEGDWELTTLKAASTHLFVRNYDVSDAKRLGVHMEMLVDAIPRHVRGSWVNYGGDAGTIDGVDPEWKLLKITQTWAGHDGITSLLEQLRAGPKSDRYRQFVACAAQLEQPIKGRWDYQNAILEEVLIDIGTREGIQLRIDKRELELERLTPQIAVAIKAANGSLGSNLSLLLNPHGLTVVPLQDNGLQWTVTTIPASRSMQLSVIHPVRMTTRPPYDLSPIIQKIQGLKNSSWMDLDGEGGEITPFGSFSGVALAVLQNWDTQVAILQMLK